MARTSRKQQEEEEELEEELAEAEAAKQGRKGDPEQDDEQDDEEDEAPARRPMPPMAKSRKSVAPPAPVRKAATRYAEEDDDPEALSYVDFGYLLPVLAKAVADMVMPGIDEMRKSLVTVAEQNEQLHAQNEALTKALMGDDGAIALTKAMATKFSVTAQTTPAATETTPVEVADTLAKATTPAPDAANAGSEDAVDLRRESVQLMNKALSVQNETGKRVPGMSSTFVDAVLSGKATAEQVDAVRKGLTAA